MVKKLRTEPIYIAPQILGQIKDGIPFVRDESSSSNLNVYDVEDKILIYERQVKGWFLDIARKLVDKDDNGFVVLMIAVSYIEGNENFRQDNDNLNTGQLFKNGMKRIFGGISNSDVIYGKLFDQVRNGLFHDGMSREKIVINNTFEKPIYEEDENTIKINQKLFLEKIYLDFEKYIKDIKTINNPLRDKFDNKYNNLFKNIHQLNVYI